MDLSDGDEFRQGWPCRFDLLARILQVLAYTTLLCQVQNRRQGNCFGGQIGGLAVFSRALTDAEMVKLGSPRE